MRSLTRSLSRSLVTAAVAASLLAPATAVADVKVDLDSSNSNSSEQIGSSGQIGDKETGSSLPDSTKKFFNGVEDALSDPSSYVDGQFQEHSSRNTPGWFWPIVITTAVFAALGGTLLAMFPEGRLKVRFF